MSNITAKILDNLVEECEKLAAETEAQLSGSPINVALLRACIKQFEGLLRLLEIRSGARLANELLQAVDTFRSSPEKISEHAQLFISLTALFVRLVRNSNRLEVDTPCLFLPEIAKLRSVQGLPPIYEYQLLSEYSWPAGSALQAFTPPAAHLDEPLKRLRHLYQLGLLDVIQGRNRAKALTLLARVAERLGQFLSSENERNYWLLVEKVILALANGDLVLRPDRARLLSVIERQLKALCAANAAGKSPYPVGLWGALAALLALSPVRGDVDRHLRHLLHLPDLPFADTDIAETRLQLVNEPPASNVEMIEQLRKQLASMQGMLSLLDNELAFNDEDSRNLRQMLEAIAQQCRELGLTRAQERFSGHCTTFAANASQVLTPTVEQLRNLTESVLYLECLLLDCQAQKQLSADDLKQINHRGVEAVIEANLMKSGLNAVWSECLAQLTTAKEYLDDINGGLSIDESVPELASVFDRIRGTAIVIGDSRVVDVAWRCGDFVREGLSKKDPAMARNTRLATFADAVIGLEYHLENCASGDATDERPLSVADEYLASLGA